jgi:phosphoribosylanthranilate isomerase
MSPDLDTLLPKGLIQVAGVHDLKEATLLLDHGVNLIGIPLRLPVNSEDLRELEARKICRALPGKCCIITYMNSASDIIDFSIYMETSFHQLHGEVDCNTLKQVKTALPNLHIIKSLVIGRFSMEQLLQQVMAFSPWVSAFITDSYNPETGAEGATGITHDWNHSRRLLEASPRPVILAGGLNADNVAEAIEKVRPWGVDVHTGVENSDGWKTPESLSAFVTAARQAFKRHELH